MRRFKLIGLAIFAVVALSAIASAAASAEVTLPTGFLPGTAGTDFTGTSGSGTLTASGGTIVCKSDTTTGALGATKTLATATVTFKECTAFGIFGAKSLGGTEGTIVVNVNLHLCYIKKAAPIEVGALTEITTKDPNGVHIEVAGKLIEIKGDQVGKVTPVNGAAGTNFEVVYKAGTQCEGATEEYLAEENETGGFKKATEATTEKIVFLTAQTLDA